MVWRYPHVKEEVGGLIPSCEISSLLDGVLPKWSTTSCALALARRPSVSIRKRKKEIQFHKNLTHKDYLNGYITK